MSLTNTDPRKIDYFAKFPWPRIAAPILDFSLPPAQRTKIEHRMRVYIDLLRETLIELKKTGQLRDIDPTVAAFSIAGMILWLPRWFRNGGRLSPEEAADEIASMALGGLLRASSSSAVRRARSRAS